MEITATNGPTLGLTVQIPPRASQKGSLKGRVVTTTLPQIADRVHGVTHKQ